MQNISMSYEPMDIDISNNSEVAMDVSYENHNCNSNLIKPFLREDISCTPLHDKTNFSSSVAKQPEYQSIKKYHIIIDKKKGINSKRRTILLSFIIITCVSIIAFQIINIQCYNLDLESLKGKLHSAIYGQEEAINAIIDILQSDSEHKILFFYGGTGVGKTYTVSLLLANAWNYSNVYHYTLPTFKTDFSSEIMIGLSLCKSAILVVDDVNINNDVYVINHVKNVIKKSEELGRNMTVILIYNYSKDDDTLFSEQLLQKFLNVNALKQVIRFESLTVEHLKKCIENELGDQKLSKPEFQNIMRNFNVLLHGCKGVSKRINYLKFV
ncbi:uncharacterized protein LOC113511749 isoform X1 [Galleria mellonella]|nr:uncharacterized protein LOC113511749 isoform X1 [Galleria mellonella]XP_031769264.1 uncharacterized protein LOC113511749 isoform X1 [Galleria mellonella]XP_031769265.1 uncharacterized protein LOC113511749 isoform X1 [Galleria mellonella]